MIGKHISHYRVLDKLGAGGMGIVFKAEDLRLGRNVALKFLPPEVGEEEKRIKRFLQEAKAASSLDHPNLCTIYEIDQTSDGQMFIAMALYEGETLKEKIHNGSIHLENAIDFAIQMANGLAIAHENGIVHRDIKPANVMVTRSGLIKILDFGLAKLTGASQITEAETAVGTVAYMSPEQSTGKPVDQRTDIWSWGVVLYEMLTGSLPYQADNPMQLLHILISPQPIQVVHPLVPPPVASIIEKTLYRNVEERFRSMSELSQELRNLKLSGSPSLTITTAGIPPAAPTIPEFGVTVTPQKTEKKPLTFVVSGITGYTDLLEQFTFEDANKFLNRVQKGAEVLAERYRAVLNEFDPEKIVTLFGIPAAQENDFVTAVQFAFDLQAAVKEIARESGDSCEKLVSVRSGIHSGLVLMQFSMRTNCKYEITGLPFQMAVTLSSNAKPSEVVIAQESRRLTRNLFVAETREPIRIPSLSRSSNALSLLSQSESSGTTFVGTYTGREKELDTLQRCWQRSLQSEGQLVTIVGEAGVGKSRLFAEFKERLNSDVRFLFSQCHPYGASIPYAPFREVLANAIDQHPYSSAEEVIDKILQVNPMLQDFLPLYLHLLSLPSDRFPFPKHLEGENLRLAILDALSVFVLIDASKPVILFLEDWHWADEASQNTLKQVLEMVPDQKVFVAVTYRPDSSLEWASPVHFTQIYLDPLDSSNCRELMLSILGAKEISQQLAQMIQDRSGGNPFFLEEICFSLQEQEKIRIDGETASLIESQEDLRLPETIQALILSRLDRLTRSTREVLQYAAVIGREFTRTILQRLSNDKSIASSLTSLKSLGLIQQVHVLPEATYKFRHALTQEVAYESLLARDKKEIHQRVAESIEDVYKDRMEERFDILAEHFSRAENWLKAVQYGMKSSKKAISLGQFSEALHILKKAQRWFYSLPMDASMRSMEIDLLLQEERLCETLGIRDRQEQILNDLLAAVEQTNDESLEMEVCRRMGEFLTLVGRFEDAESALMRALELSKPLQDRTGERTTLRSIGFMRWHQGRNEEAVESNEKALAIDREQDDKEAIATDLTNLGSLLRNKGDHARALDVLGEALQIYRQISDPVKHAAALHLTGNVHRELGNSDEAMQYMQAAMAVSTQYKLVIMQTFHLTSLANMCWQEGKTENCLELQKRAVGINRKSHYADGLANSLRLTGETLLNLGSRTEAIPYLSEAAGLFRRLKDTRNEVLVWNKLVDIYEEDKSWEVLLTGLLRLKELHQHENPDQVVKLLERLAKVCRNMGATDLALQYYREAIEHYEQQGQDSNVAAILNSIAIIEWKEGQFPIALQDYERALNIFENLGDEVHAGLMMNSIGLTLKSMGRYDEALTMFQNAIQVNQRNGQQRLEGHSLAAIADVYSEKGDLEKAIHYYSEALQLKRLTGDVKGEAWMLFHLARLQSKGGYEEGLEDYRIEAEKKVADHGDEQLKDAWKNLQRTFDRKNGGDRA